VTCPSLLRRRPEEPDSPGPLSDEPRKQVREALPSPAEWLRGDDTLAQFVRFVLIGGTSTVVYALLFLSLEELGYLTAHVIATVASSMLANDLHRRLTFHAEDRVSWLTAQIEAGGVSLFGLLATSTALAWLDATVGSAPPLLQIALVAAVTGTIGLVRFLALRWIFRPTGVPAPQ
jgi:putative flippase GtrA